MPDTLDSLKSELATLAVGDVRVAEAVDVAQMLADVPHPFRVLPSVEQDFLLWCGENAIEPFFQDGGHRVEFRKVANA